MLKKESVRIDSLEKTTLIKDMNIPIGKYYFRIIGKNEEGVVFSSDIRTLNILLSGNINLEESENRIILVCKDKSNKIDINFSWGKIDLEGNYTIQLSKSNKFSPVDYEKSIHTNRITINNLNPGKYYWIVKLMDSEGNNLISSHYRIINIQLKMNNLEMTYLPDDYK